MSAYMTLTTSSSTSKSSYLWVAGVHKRGGKHRWKKHPQGRYCTRCTALQFGLDPVTHALPDNLMAALPPSSTIAAGLVLGWSVLRW